MYHTFIKLDHARQTQYGVQPMLQKPCSSITKQRCLRL